MKKSTLRKAWTVVLMLAVVRVILAFIGVPNDPALLITLIVAGVMVYKRVKRGGKRR